MTELEPSGMLFPPNSRPTPACHAASIVEVDKGLFATWFGGSKEGKADVCIWGSCYKEGRWEKPFLIAKGISPKGSPCPCWNPVVTNMPGGRLQLYYKVGPSPREWWGMVCESSDNGHTWSSFEKLPEGFLGPIKNKPLLVNGSSLICPSSTEHNGWQVHFEIYNNGLPKKISAVDSGNLQAIQPALLSHRSGKLQAVCRTRRSKVIATTFSEDGGKSWSPLRPLQLPNPNSGIDALTLQDGRHLLVYNHTNKGRTPLNIALSEDGINWQQKLILESSAGEFSYPAVIQTSDGLVHIVYTWQRLSIRHRIFRL